jgi:Integrase zinc binding domain
VKKNIQADSLSRWPDLCSQGIDNEDVIVLPEHLFVNLINMKLQKKIANAKNMDYDAAEAIKELLKQGPREAKKDLMDWEVEDFEGENVLFYKGKNYVPIDAELQREIVQRYHDHPTAEHPGELQTFNTVKEHYWWPGLWVFIKNHVQGCGICQQFKIDRNPTKPVFMPLEGAKSTQPFASCFMDLIMDLPPIDGCNSILVMVDRGNTKGAILIPMTKTLMQEGAGQLLLDNLYKRFGLPDKMLSDREPQFAAKAFCELLKLLGIKLNLTTAYHPQTDGATERVNQEIKAYLLIYCSVHPTEWKNSLSMLKFTHNNWRHTDQNHTSFELMNGEAPVAIPTTFENTKFPSVVKKIKNLVTSREEALAAHELARSCMAERIKSNFVPFKKGQIVWLDSRHLKTNYHKKMAPKQEGPLKIKEVLELVTYQLKLLES